VIGMTGAKGAEFAAMCDVALVTPTESTPNIQEGHIAMGHAFCLIVERALFPHGKPGSGPLAAKRRAPARGSERRAKRAPDRRAGRERRRA
jgi:hypothetical protein